MMMKVCFTERYYSKGVKYTEELQYEKTNNNNNTNNNKCNFYSALTINTRWRCLQ